MKALLAAVAIPLLTAVACTDTDAKSRSERQPLVEQLHLETMIVVERPPVIAAQLADDLPIATRAASRIDRNSLAARQSSRRVTADALPFLTETAIGQRFLSAAMPRALAIGMPAEFCPAVASATGTPATPAQDVAVRALAGCLDQLNASKIGCGCRIMALDDLLLVPREETAYATGTAARLQAPALGIDLILVAEEEPGEPVLLRDLRGPVARVTRGEGDAVTLELLATGGRFTGYRIPVGFRRGRVAERIYVSDGEGHHLSALIGFAPAELADTAAAWLAWPDQG